MRAHLFVVCVVLARAQRRQCWRSDCGQQYLGPREDEWSIPRDCTVLNLQMSKVDDENAPALARELAALTSPGLEELDIGWNDLSDVGATLIAEALLPPRSALAACALAHNPSAIRARWLSRARRDSPAHDVGSLRELRERKGSRGRARAHGGAPPFKQRPARRRRGPRAAGAAILSPRAAGRIVIGIGKSYVLLSYAWLAESV